MNAFLVAMALIAVADNEVVLNGSIQRIDYRRLALVIHQRGGNAEIKFTKKTLAELDDKPAKLKDVLHVGWSCQFIIDKKTKAVTKIRTYTSRYTEDEKITVDGKIVSVFLDKMEVVIEKDGERLTIKLLDNTSVFLDGTLKDVEALKKGQDIRTNFGMRTKEVADIRIYEVTSRPKKK